MVIAGAATFLIELKKGDKLLISKYLFDESNFKIDKEYYKTIKIDDIYKLQVEPKHDETLNYVALFSRDMANNKIIKILG